MGNEVFANGNEIACKSGDGKVIAAFPDVCLSPPSPPAGPIPVPYPDTSFSKDMKKGSKKVKIDGKEVMLKDKSFYKTSPLGNEAATKSFGAGVVSHVITGKTYFVAWSMDVKFEGKNVDRHIDLTTSNHASPMGNSAPSPNGEGVAPAPSEKVKEKCDHDYDCNPRPQKTGDKNDKINHLEQGKKEGDIFEARAVKHNSKDIKSGSDVGAEFRCKKCPCTKEVDHITRDDNDNITKVVQCKADLSKTAGRESNKGVLIKPKQLKEDRKVIKAINECQEQSGVEAKLEYKIEAGEAAKKAEEFLLKKEPPLITHVL